MKRKILLSPAVLAIVVVFLLFFSTPLTIGQTDDASLKMQNANNAIGQAFNGLLSAEKAGANVTGLIEQLNIATGLLSQAENSYKSGDTSAARNFADQVTPIAQQVAAQATAVEESATTDSQHAFEFTVIFVVIGSFLFVLALFLVWRRFKSGYIKSLSEAKPELVCCIRIKGDWH